MFSETFIAVFLLVCLGCFSIINLHNVLRFSRRRRGVKSYAEVDRPSGLSIILASFGTIVYFVEAFLYPLLFLLGFHLYPYNSFFLQLPYISYIQTLGFSLTGLGYIMFIRSVIVRGRYAISWKMPENHRLVTWGPYHYVRHPSYLGYFLIFFGLFFL